MKTIIKTSLAAAVLSSISVGIGAASFATPQITSGIPAVSTKGSVTAMMAKREITTPPMVNLFKFNVPQASLKTFNAQGVKNLTASMREEPGTLSMNVAHVKDNPTEVYVLEAYRDDDAYRAHRDSEHFKEYVNTVGASLTDRVTMRLQPVIMLEQPGALRFIDNRDALVNLVKVTVKADQNEAFKAVVVPEMKQSIQDEPGVLVMYGLVDPDKPNEWYFFEVYRNKDAYTEHRGMPVFKDYLAKTKDMLVDKEFHSLSADAMVNQGGLYYSEL